MADKSKVKEDGRVWKITNINITVTHRDPNYTLEHKTKDAMSLTGKWRLFAVKHKSGFPEFVGRWDEKQSALDIDRFDSADMKPKKDFEGHHTDQTTKKLRRFKVHIEWPKGQAVFAADISFNITRVIVSSPTRGLKIGGSVKDSEIKIRKRELP